MRKYLRRLIYAFYFIWPLLSMNPGPGNAEACWDLRLQLPGWFLRNSMVCRRDETVFGRSRNKKEPKSILLNLERMLYPLSV